MPRSTASFALRYGVPYGVIILALAAANYLIQAKRHTIGPSAQGLVVFSFLYFAVVLALLLASGFRPSRATGRAQTGIWTGAVTGAVPLALYATGFVLLRGTPQSSPGMQVTVDALVVLFFGGAAAIAGALISLPAALVGRARYRNEHAAELAVLAAERAAHHVERSEVDAGRRARKKRDNLTGVIGGVALAATFLVIIYLPIVALNRVAALSEWQGVFLALASLIVSVVVLRLSPRRRRIGYLIDLFGVVCLTFASMLAIAEVFGIVVGLIPAVTATYYFWRAADRYMSKVFKPRTEIPERPPVQFRHDGEMLVFYPSRRKLAAHGAFAIAVLLAFSALAYLFRNGGATPVIAFGVFALMGLIGSVPDLLRLLIRWPVLSVDASGITDRASAAILGFGLIPWHEIVTVYDAGTLRGGRFRELAIVPISFQRLLRRQSWFKRPFLRLGSVMGGGSIYLSSIFLAEPPIELARRINAYVETHAPAEFLGVDEDEAEGKHVGEIAHENSDATSQLIQGDA